MYDHVSLYIKKNNLHLLPILSL